MSSIPYLSLTALRRKLRSGELSSEQVVKAFLEQIRLYNPSINAVTSLDPNGALIKAQECDRALLEGWDVGPLHGIPFTIKDAQQAAGFRSTYGIPSLNPDISEGDSYPVRKLKNMGGIPLGRTNVPMGAFDWQCSNPIFGRTNNPWDLGRTPGGSSGGAAAAVAAGMTPFEIGSDLGGSLRYPAHCCGVYSLRTSFGLIPLEGFFPPKSPGRLETVLVHGPIARHPEDLRLILEALTETESVGAAPLKSTKIAWVDSMAGLGLGEASHELFEDFLNQLRAAGLSIERAWPADLDFEEMIRVWGTIVGYEYKSFLPSKSLFGPVGWIVSEALRRFWLDNSRVTRAFLGGVRSNLRDYQSALRRRDEMQESLTNFLEHFDLWITPTAPDPAIEHKEGRPRLHVNSAEMEYGDYFGGFLLPVAITHHPILTMPFALTQRGLPIAVQLHAKPGRDFHLTHWAEELRAFTSPITYPFEEK